MPIDVIKRCKCSIATQVTIFNNMLGICHAHITQPQHLFYHRLSFINVSFTLKLIMGVLQTQDSKKTCHGGHNMYL